MKQVYTLLSVSIHAAISWSTWRIATDETGLHHYNHDLHRGSGSASVSVPVAISWSTSEVAIDETGLHHYNHSLHQDEDLPWYQYLQQQDYSLHQDQDLPQYQYLQQITAYIRIRIYLCISTCSRITAYIRDSNRPKQNELKAAQVMPRLVMLCQSFRI